MWLNFYIHILSENPSNILGRMNKWKYNIIFKNTKGEETT